MRIIDCYYIKGDKCVKIKGVGIVYNIGKMIISNKLFQGICCVTHINPIILTVGIILSGSLIGNKN